MLKSWYWKANGNQQEHYIRTLSSYIHKHRNSTKPWISSHRDLTGFKTSPFTPETPTLIAGKKNQHSLNSNPYYKLYENIKNKSNLK